MLCFGVFRRLLVFGMLFLAVAPPAVSGSALPTASVATPSVQVAIAAAVEKERALFGGKTPVPGVLVGVWDGSGASYIQAFGDADLAAGRPMTSDDRFRIGSNTKTFVVSVLLQLVDEGRLGLDDPVSRFSLGVAIPNAENITIRQLCQMRSGLFEAFDTPELNAMDITPTAEFDPVTLIGWAVKQKPYFAPGQGYRYSNTNYLLLGLIVESVAGESIGELIRKRLIEPFDLDATAYPANQSMPDPWAHGYGFNKQGGWEDISGTIPVSLMGAAGEMISDMADMKRWVKLYVTGATNAPATQSERLACVPTGDGNLSFGLGIGCSAGWFGYTGGLPGYNTAGWYFPAGDITVIAWVTLQADKPSPGVANSIFRDIATIMTPGKVPFGPGPP